jgi:hypothetical protein
MIIIEIITINIIQINNKLNIKFFKIKAINLFYRYNLKYKIEIKQIIAIIYILKMIKIKIKCKIL